MCSSDLGAAERFAGRIPWAALGRLRRRKAHHPLPIMLSAGDGRSEEAACLGRRSRLSPLAAGQADDSRYGVQPQEPVQQRQHPVVGRGLDQRQREESDRDERTGERVARAVRRIGVVAGFRGPDEQDDDGQQRQREQCTGGDADRGAFRRDDQQQQKIGREIESPSERAVFEEGGSVFHRLLGIGSIIQQNIGISPFLLSPDTMLCESGIRVSFHRAVHLFLVVRSRISQTRNGDCMRPLLSPNTKFLFHPWSARSYYRFFANKN